MTQMSENALDDLFNEVESGRGDANFEQNFRESDFGAALEDHVEFSDEVEEIERQPLSVDSEMAHAQQREQELTRHVSQIAEEKPDNDNNWTSFLDITPDPTFASANLMPQIQMLSGLRFAFAEGTVFETGSSTTNGDPAVYVNHAECKRENQRTTRFGVSLESSAMDQLPLNSYKLAVWTSLPGQYHRMTTCSKHKKPENDDFMRCWYMNTLVNQTIPADTVVGLDQHPPLWSMPLPKNNDQNAIEVIFYCFTSCLKKGNAKNNLKLNIAVLDGQNRLLQHASRLVRITANPHRDAGMWPGSAAQSKRAPKRQLSSRRVPLKAIQAGPSSRDSDEDYTPVVKRAGRIKQEPPAYDTLAMEDSVPRREPQLGGRTRDEAIQQIVEALQPASREESYNKLLRMDSQEQRNTLEQCSELILQTINLRARQARQRP